MKPKEWIEQIHKGLEFRRIYGQEDDWYGTEKLFFERDVQVFGPNLIQSTGDALLSDLTVPNPRILVTPRNGEMMVSAEILEALDNYLLERLRLRESVEDCFLWVFLWGWSCAKIGYDSEFGFDYKGMAPGMDGTLSQFDKKGRRIETGPGETGMPWVIPVMPHDIVVPWGTRKLRNAPWVAHRIVRHVDDIKADMKYKGTPIATMSMKDFMESYQTTMKPYRTAVDLSGSTSSSEEVFFAELWEIHDQEDGKVRVVQTGGDGFLREEEDSGQINGLPFVELSEGMRTSAMWTTGSARYLRQSQEEMDDISQTAQIQRRISVIQFLYRKGAIAKEEFDKFMRMQIGAGIAVEEGVGSLDEVIKALTPVNNNNALYVDADFVRRNAKEVVGMSSNQMGEFDKSTRRTATEVQTVSQAASTRMSRKHAMMGGFYGEIIRKVNQLVFTFWDDSHMVRVTDPWGGEKWEKVDPERIKGEYDYSVSFSSEPPVSEGSDFAKSLQAFQILAADPMVDPVALRGVLARAFRDPSIKKVFLKERPMESQNAPISGQMSGMPAGGGSLPTQNGEASGSML